MLPRDGLSFPYRAGRTSGPAPDRPGLCRVLLGLLGWPSRRRSGTEAGAGDVGQGRLGVLGDGVVEPEGRRLGSRRRDSLSASSPILSYDRTSSGCWSRFFFSSATASWGFRSRRRASACRRRMPTSSSFSRKCCAISSASHRRVQDRQIQLHETLGAPSDCGCPDAGPSGTRRSPA